jgi:ribosomal protein S18 acetylase RimI-like enzyme
LGGILIEAAKGATRQAGYRRLWLITINDNLEVLCFYQKQGFVLVAVHRNAMERARQFKPTKA